MAWGLESNALEVVDGCHALNVQHGHAVAGQCNWHRDLAALLSNSDTLKTMCAIDSRIVPRTFENVFVFEYLADQFDAEALEAIAEACMRLPRSAAAVTLGHRRLAISTVLRAEKVAEKRALDKMKARK